MRVKDIDISKFRTQLIKVTLLIESELLRREIIDKMGMRNNEKRIIEKLLRSTAQDNIITKELPFSMGVNLYTFVGARAPTMLKLAPTMFKWAPTMVLWAPTKIIRAPTMVLPLGHPQ